MRPDFAQCGQEFIAHSSDIYARYVYNGTVAGILASNRPALITLDGCKKLCGDGIAYYPWYTESTLPSGEANLKEQEGRRKYYYNVGSTNHWFAGTSPIRVESSMGNNPVAVYAFFKC